MQRGIFFAIKRLGWNFVLPIIIWSTSPSTPPATALNPVGYTLFQIHNVVGGLRKYGKHGESGT